jgi:hypothetical protein
VPELNKTDEVIWAIYDATVLLQHFDYCLPLYIDFPLSFGFIELIKFCFFFYSDRLAADFPLVSPHYTNGHGVLLALSHPVTHLNRS